MILLCMISFTAFFIYLTLCWFGIWYISLSKQKFIRILFKGDEHELAEKQRQNQAKTKSHSKKK